MREHGHVWRRIVAVLAVGLPLMAGASAAAGADAARTVTIREFTYAPAVLRVTAGTTVRWVNRDEEPHTVTSASGAFASAGLSRDDVFTYRFTRPGTYQYACALHPHMKATIVVQ